MGIGWSSCCRGLSRGLLLLALFARRREISISRQTIRDEGAGVGVAINCLALRRLHIIGNCCVLRFNCQQLMKCIGRGFKSQLCTASGRPACVVERHSTPRKSRRTAGLAGTGASPRPCPHPGISLCYTQLCSALLCCAALLIIDGCSAAGQLLQSRRASGERRGSNAGQ